MLGEQDGVNDLHHVKLVTIFFEALAKVILDGFICFITEIRVLLAQELLIDLVAVLTFFDLQVGNFSLSLSRYDVTRHLFCNFIGILNIKLDLSFFFLVSNHLAFNFYRVLNRSFFLHILASFMDYVWLIFLSFFTDFLFCYCSKYHLFIIIC